MSAPQDIIKVRNLHKGFGEKHVLRGIDLELPKGKSLVVIGGSGTGKSVLIKCIIGLLKADKGTIEIEGRNIARLSDRDRTYMTQRSGMLFQGAALFDSLKVWENIAFRLLYGENTAHKNARERALDCLTQVGLAPEVGDLLPSELSGGMQKRVSLARAIASNPEILFFDEPTTGLDPIMSDIINNLIVERVRALGAAAISITHDLASARKIADEVAMLYEGKIIWRGSPDDMMHSGNPMVDQFVHGRAEGPIKMAMRRQ